jgi:hypothetical protein
MVLDVPTGTAIQKLDKSPVVDTILTGSFISTKQQYSIPDWATVTIDATSIVNITDIPRTYLF